MKFSRHCVMPKENLCRNEVAVLIDWAAAELSARGIDAPNLNAQELLGFVMGVPRQFIYICDEEVSGGHIERFKRLVAERSNGRPLQYVLGECGFYGLKFKVSPGVFIPRPETEILVGAVLNRINRLLAAEHCSLSTKHCFHILDLGTGCGNIAISLTKSSGDCKIYLSDISKKALDIAAENARLHGVEDSAEFLHGDLFEPAAGLAFDAVVSNPPYIPEKDIPGLAKDVQAEPAAALSGGRDGLDFYRRIISEAPRHLNDGGILAMELGDGQAGYVEGLMAASGRFCNIEVVKDYNSKDRVILGCRQ